MRRLLRTILAIAPIVIASQTVFSVHDDILAFPQYEVIFSSSLISDKEASIIVEQASSASPSSHSTSNSKAIESPDHHARPHPTSTPFAFDPAHETYEIMRSGGEDYLCTIPIVITPPRNETSEAEAREEEQKELARASTRGWELLQDLEGNCLHFVSGWWSYSFCYNSEVTQYHPLPVQPGKAPRPDPQTALYVLGRTKRKASKEDEWGNEVQVHQGKKPEPPKTELQVKGDTRYLVQKMEGGTVCDLTGKPRRIEVQYHCNLHSNDRIGYIKEITTCSYLLVVYTPRLCNDVAFMPPKETKANPIVCRVIVPEEEIESRNEAINIEHELQAHEPMDKRPIVGGVVVGGRKWIKKGGAQLPIPTSFGRESKPKTAIIIARAKSKAEGGLVESVSDAELMKMDVDPKTVEKLKDNLRKMAGNNGWRVQVVQDAAGPMQILGIVDGQDDDYEKVKDGEEGSEEVFKDEL